MKLEFDNMSGRIIWASDLADLWTEAYGEHGRSQLLGALFANVSADTIQRLVNQAREEIEKMEVGS